MRIGLISNSTSVPFSLECVEHYVKTTGLTYDLKTTSIYVNNSNRNVEAKFVAPTDVVSIYYFKAVIEDRELIFECRPRAEANTTYDEALKTGHTVIMSEIDEQREDMFQISIGNFPPKAKIEITMKCVGHMDATNITDDHNTYGRITMVLPTVLNPRYIPAELNMPVAIANVTSPVDSFQAQYKSDDDRKAYVTLIDPFVPDHDFKLIINLKDKLSTSVVIAKGDNQITGILSQPCLMVQYLPDLSKFEKMQDLRTEFIFLIDRSGSMGGSNIQYAKDALLLFLKSLPENCYFNVIGFGSTFKKLFEQSNKYTEDTYKKALQYESSIRSNMGGTEVLAPMKEALKDSLPTENHCRSVIFMTDGAVSNVNEIIGVVHCNSFNTRVFTIGIGDGASTHLVHGIANAGHGSAAFIKDGLTMGTEVMKIVRSALEPHARDINCHASLVQKMPDGTKRPVNLAILPKPIPPILSGHFTTIFAFLVTDNLEEISGDFTITFDVCAQKQKVSIDLTSYFQGGGGVDFDETALHHLAARSQIRHLAETYHSLEATEHFTPDKRGPMQKELRDQMVELSCKLNVLCPYTAFIAVDPKKQERSEGYISDNGPVITMKQQNYSWMDTSEPYDSVDSAMIETDGGSDQSPVLKAHYTFTTVLNLQQFKGSWSLDETFANAISVKLKVMKAYQPKALSTTTNSKITSDVWATALAIAFFNIVFPDRKLDYEMFLSKSIAWLLNEFQKSGNKTEAEQTKDILLNVAYRFLQGQNIEIHENMGVNS